MESDKDIKTWDQRLTDQSIRHWENYVHHRIDLSTARLDEQFIIPGEFIYVEDAYDDDTSLAKIKLQKNSNDALDLENGVQIQTVFTQFFITNEALAGEWLDLVIGINFIYKKKIAGDGFVNPIVTAAGVDLVLLPGAGGITQIGDAGAQSYGLVNNDDLFVSGKLEVDGPAWFDDDINTYGALLTRATVRMYGAAFYKYFGYTDSYIYESKIAEFVTIPIGQGMAGVNSITNLCPANCLIKHVVCKVQQAPGGGATTLDVGRTNGGNLDEFIDGIATALNTKGYSAADHDAATTGPIWNDIDDTLTLTTDANVTIADMIVEVVVFYEVENNSL